MNVEQAVIARLLSLSAVTALTEDRWWLYKFPQAPVYPAGRVQLVDDPADYGLRGHVSPVRSRVQIDYAVDLRTAESVGEPLDKLVAAGVAAIHGDGLGPDATGLSGWTGEIDDTEETIRIHGTFRVGRQITWAPDELSVLMAHIDYWVWWQRITTSE